jgi:hypothetical protein
VQRSWCAPPRACRTSVLSRERGEWRRGWEEVDGRRGHRRRMKDTSKFTPAVCARRCVGSGAGKVSEGAQDRGAARSTSRKNLPTFPRPLAGSRTSPGAISRQSTMFEKVALTSCNVLGGGPNCIERHGEHVARRRGGHREGEERYGETVRWASSCLTDTSACTREGEGEEACSAGDNWAKYGFQKGAQARCAGDCSLGGRAAPSCFAASLTRERCIGRSACMLEAVGERCTDKAGRWVRGDEGGGGESESGRWGRSVSDTNHGMARVGMVGKRYVRTRGTMADVQDVVEVDGGGEGKEQRDMRRRRGRRG